MIDECKLYEKILICNNNKKEIILKAINLFRDYIIKHKLILTGGQSIDYLLKLKGNFLYEKDVIPDYDVLTPDFHKHAYNFANILNKEFKENINVINAYHNSTLKVGIDFNYIADITYIPKNIYDNIITYNYKNIRVIDPYYINLTQLHVFTYPFNYAMYGLLGRWEKDMKRYDLLNKYYPYKNKKLNKKLDTIKTNKIILKKNKLNIERTKPQINNNPIIISFISSLCFWYKKAFDKGFKSKFNINIFNFKNNKDSIEFTIPDSYNIIDIMTNNLTDIKDDGVYINPILDFYPESFRTNKFNYLNIHKEIFNIYEYDKINFCKLHEIMKYSLVKKLFLLNNFDKKNILTYHFSYILSKEILTFGINNNYNDFLPDSKFLVPYKINCYSNIDYIDKDFDRNELPKRYYLKKDISVPNYFYDYNPEEYKLFQFDGLETINKDREHP